MGVELLVTLNSPECLASAIRLFGPGDEPRWKVRPVQVDGKVKDGVSVGFQRFERLKVVAFPHPSRPPSDDYMASFRDVVSPVIADYKAERGFAP